MRYFQELQTQAENLESNVSVDEQRIGSLEITVAELLTNVASLTVAVSPLQSQIEGETAARQSADIQLQTDPEDDCCGPKDSLQLVPV